jgi:hypothetical protein
MSGDIPLQAVTKCKQQCTKGVHTPCCLFVATYQQRIKLGTWSATTFQVYKTILRKLTGLQWKVSFMDVKLTGTWETESNRRMENGKNTKLHNLKYSPNATDWGEQTQEHGMDKSCSMHGHYTDCYHNRMLKWNLSCWTWLKPTGKRRRVTSHVANNRHVPNHFHFIRPTIVQLSAFSLTYYKRNCLLQRNIPWFHKFVPKVLRKHWS